MKQAYRTFFQGMGFLLIAGTLVQAWADTKPNPYESIPVRNPFALKPPPPPPDQSSNVPAPPVVPPATVEVTGIVTGILSSKRVLLEIVPGPGKPMIRPILSEGERIESVEVVAINIEKNEVTIKNGPVTTNLTFRVAKAAPTPTAPPAGALPGVIPQPFQAVVQPLQPLNPSASLQPPTGRGGVMVAGGAPPITPAAVPGPDGNFRSIPTRNPQYPIAVPGGMQNQNQQYQNQNQPQYPGNPTPNSPYQLHKSVGGVPNQQLQLPIPGGN